MRMKILQHMFRAAVAMLVVLPGSRLIAQSSPPQQPDDSPPSSAASARTASNAAWAQVLDEHVPLDQRKRVLAGIEEQVQPGDQHALYALGSLFHMGQRSRSCPVPQDLDKASLYLGNAAVHGSILAMAKMAEVRFAQRQYREAMNWAQIYGHYEALLPKDDRPHEGYVAELIRRIADKLGQSAMPGIMRDVDSFVAAHDAEIRAGTDSQLTGGRLHPTRGAKSYMVPEGRLAPMAGFADYLLAFRADGSLASAWLLDATPDPELGIRLQKYAEEMHVPSASADAQRPLRYAWMPVMYDDGRYRVR